MGYKSKKIILADILERNITNMKYKASEIKNDKGIAKIVKIEIPEMTKKDIDNAIECATEKKSINDKITHLKRRLTFMRYTNCVEKGPHESITPNYKYKKQDHRKVCEECKKEFETCDKRYWKWKFYEYVENEDYGKTIATFRFFCSGECYKKYMQKKIDELEQLLNRIVRS